MRLALGLMPGSPEATTDCEPESTEDRSASLSFCDVRISLPRDATLARRNTLDLDLDLGKDVVDTSPLAAASDALELASWTGAASDEASISSTGSAVAHCIETSLVDEPRETLSLSMLVLGLRTASAAISARSWMRGLSGDLGVGNLSLFSQPLTVETKLWLALMLGLFAETVRNASDVSELDRDPSHTLGRGGTGGIAACRLASGSS